MNEAIPIALPVWKDPQNFVIVEHVRDEAEIYFRCWSDSGNEIEEVGCLEFEGVWYLRTERFLGRKSYPSIIDTELKSYYLTVPKSDLLNELLGKRAETDVNWQQYDKRNYRHYVVESHDFYYDIVASKVKFKNITGPDCKRFFEIWSGV